MFVQGAMAGRLPPPGASFGSLAFTAFRLFFGPKRRKFSFGLSCLGASPLFAAESSSARAGAALAPIMRAN
jgi:hypothetical protein